MEDKNVHKDEGNPNVATAKMLGMDADSFAALIEERERVWVEEGEKLPHILWRVAKQLVSLLEKEYGFGQKEARDSSNRQITCSGCGGTFDAIDHRTGSSNEIIYCSNCAKSMHGIGQREVSKKRQSTSHVLVGREEGPVFFGAHSTVNIE